MSRDKQIEEMAKVMVDENNKEVVNALSMVFASSAEVLYNAGYRKSTDVAEEIFAEIEKIAMHGVTPFGLCLMSMGEASFAKLKKKYTVTDTNVGCKDTEET